MFGQDFYPTPPEVAAEMLDPLDLRGRTVLEPSAGSGGHLLQHPRLLELPERYRHPRHFWIFNLPEAETQTWLGRFRLDQRMWERRQVEGSVFEVRS